MPEEKHKVDYTKGIVVLSIFETEIKYVSPKEAIFHTIARKNFECNYIIIGRDHAGVGDYYGPYDTHKIFDHFTDLGIELIFFRSFSKYNKCGSIVSDKICPHPPEKHSYFSGTLIRALFKSGKEPTPNIICPKVAKNIFEFKNPFVE